MAYSTNFPHLPPPPGTSFPFVGPNYAKWAGKLPGYWYNPYDDHWHPNRNTAQQVINSQGAGTPEPSKPGLAQAALPLAAAGGAVALGQSLGTGLPGMLGLGGSTAGAGTVGGASIGAVGATGQAAATAEGLGFMGGGSAAAGVGTGAATAGGATGVAGATSGGGVAAAGGGGAASGTGAATTAGTPTAAVVAPLVMAALIGKTLYDASKKHDRQFKIDEVLAKNKFGQQIEGFDALSDKQKKDVIQGLQGLGANIQLQGFADAKGNTVKLGNAVLADPYKAQTFLRDDSGTGGSTSANPTINYEQTKKLLDDLIAKRAAGGRIQNYGFTETGSSQQIDLDAQIAKLQKTLADITTAMNKTKTPAKK